MKHIKLFHSHQPSFSITCGLHNHVSDYHAGCDSYVNVGYGEPDNILEDHLTDDHDCGDGDDAAGSSPTNQSLSLQRVHCTLPHGTEEAQAHTSSTAGSD